MSKKIELTKGKTTIVDDADYLQISAFSWYAQDGRNEHWYAARRKENRIYLLHRVLTGAKPGEYVDHKNGNGLDNRRENLRLCTQTQNNGNQRKTRGVSKYKGVHWHKTQCKWVAQIKDGNKRRYLGLFIVEENAAKAYDEVARKCFGEFARTNF